MLTMDEAALRSVLAAAGELDEATPDQVDIFWLLDLLGQLVPSDCRSWSRLDLDAVEHEEPADLVHACTTGPDSTDLHEAFWANFHHWPTGPSPRPTVVSIGDLSPPREWHQNPLYLDYFRPSGLEHEIEVWLAHPANQTNVLICTREPGRDFGERDHLVLALLRPHLDAAVRRLTPAPRLTAKERVVLDHVRRGDTNAQIARKLCISPATVRSHLEHIFTKLGVHSRTAAVTAAAWWDPSAGGTASIAAPRSSPNHVPVTDLHG